MTGAAGVLEVFARYVASGYGVAAVGLKGTMTQTQNSGQGPERRSVRDRMRLDGRVAVVTGASRGIGESIARTLADAGALVVVSSRREEAVDRVAEQIRAAGGEALGIAAHVGSTADLDALIERTVEHFGGIDIVVNNAATNPVYGPVLDADSDAFGKIFAVNVQGPLELCKRAYPLMAARGGGSIINISSVEGITPQPGLGLYSTSKAALIALTKVMAREWGGDGIRANVVCPGLVMTRFSAALWSDERTLGYALERQAVERLGVPDDIAGLVLFLASEAAAFCTGGTYVADGGYTT